MYSIIKSTCATVISTRPVILQPERRMDGAPPGGAGFGMPDITPESLVEKARRRCGEMLEEAAREAEDMRMEAENARLERDRIMREAEIEAQKLIESVHAQAEEYRRQVREEAVRQGMKEGLEKAAQDVAGILGRAEEECGELLERACGEREAILAEVEPEIFSLSIKIASKILNCELDRNESAYMDMVKKALASVKFDSNVTLRVNPGEYVRFFKAREVTLHTPAGVVHASVLSDPMVEFNGCRIETDMGNVGAGASDQLLQIAKGFGVPDALSDEDSQD